MQPLRFKAILLFTFLKSVAIHRVLILCLIFSISGGKCNEVSGEFGVFSAVKRPQTSISPSELDA